jgi:hypothetical protein
LFPEIERFCGHPRALIDITPLEISAEPAATSPRYDIVEANAMPIRRAGKARRAQGTIRQTGALAQILCDALSFDAPRSLLAWRCVRSPAMAGV